MEQLPNSNEPSRTENSFSEVDKRPYGSQSPTEIEKSDIDDETPLVDQALASVRDRDVSFAEEELAALREEYFSLQNRMKTAGLELKTKAVDEVVDVVAQARVAIRRKPLLTVLTCSAVTLLVGLAYGQTQRR
ncbi:hypothetical protein IB237_25760 [Agrobacterium sp. AGB01]|uniref:hypothetical protein n=1 Tax=Agrobacterium sp. AGB01 TaxID=2769302 RepID=UPI0017872B13|nr:hypothetical protein [Agrobacterium sp. AGB01]MBD9390610.1 hypothetical protein [Agrobacterium sp. AGB01]